VKQRKFRVSLGEKVNEVSVESYDETIEDLKPKLPVGDELKILVGNEEYSLRIEEIPVFAGPQIQTTAPPSKPEKKIVEVKGKQVKAPMRGIITKILVAVGDKVKKGDPVVVLEAMKMENLIESPYQGTVKQILVSVGNNVATGDPLVVVE